MHFTRSISREVWKPYVKVHMFFFFFLLFFFFFFVFFFFLFFIYLFLYIYIFCRQIKTNDKSHFGVRDIWTGRCNSKELIDSDRTA